jgi:hypothetical protein
VLEQRRQHGEERRERNVGARARVGWRRVFEKNTLQGFSKSKYMGLYQRYLDALLLGEERLD